MSEIANATMISSAHDQNAPLLRTEFALAKDHGSIVKAELQASAQGIFEAFLGGAKIGDDVLSPGWSSYESRLRYRRYDVTKQLQNNTDESVVLGLALGNGWFPWPAHLEREPCPVRGSAGRDRRADDQLPGRASAGRTHRCVVEFRAVGRARRRPL